jgi:hypothetical protein
VPPASRSGSSSPWKRHVERSSAYWSAVPRLRIRGRVIAVDGQWKSSQDALECVGGHRSGSFRRAPSNRLNAEWRGDTSDIDVAVLSAGKHLRGANPRPRRWHPTCTSERAARVAQPGMEPERDGGTALLRSPTVSHDLRAPPGCLPPGGAYTLPRRGRPDDEV